MGNWCSRFALLLAPFLAILAWACGESLTGLQVAPCPAPPFFTALPVAEADIDAITVFGGLGAPGHTLPTAHAGFYLTRVGVPVQSPGALQVTTLRRTTYLASPTRQGESDFAVEFHVCEDVSGWFGHLTTLSDAISMSGINWTECQTYSTATETVEACSARPSTLTLSAGSAMGTAGMSVALGLLALDFGLLDDSLGPTALGAMVAVVPRQTSGRVNRAFEQVTADGLLHCYTDASLAMSWFVAVSTGGALTIERLLHAGGASPCNAAPGAWAFGAGAATLVR